MKHTRQIKYRALLLVVVMVVLSVAASRMRGDTGTCGGASITLPFTDVSASNSYFCAIAAAYFSSITGGTSATTYDPSQNVKREEVADFASRTLDQSLRRGNRRAALDQWWTPSPVPSTAKIPVGTAPQAVKSDGADLWVASYGGTVSRIRASDGKVLGTWTGVTAAIGVVVARGRIFVLRCSSPGSLYSIDPTQTPGAVTHVTTDLGPGPIGIAYDGARIWTANVSGSVSIYKFICTAGACGTTVSAGFNMPSGILYDGANIWVTDQGDDTIKKLNSNGSIATSIPVGDTPRTPVFDGTNIWVPNEHSDSVTVIRVKDSAGNPLAQPFILTTLTGNGIDFPFGSAFDGQRVLVTNQEGNSVSLWKASDLTPLGSFSTGSDSRPLAACSDGINFWIALSTSNQLARF